MKTLEMHVTYHEDRKGEYLQISVSGVEKGPLSPKERIRLSDVNKKCENFRSTLEDANRKKEAKPEDERVDRNIKEKLENNGKALFDLLFGEIGKELKKLEPMHLNLHINRPLYNSRYD